MKIALPVRVSHTYRQRLDGSAERVFPLLCPVREVEWAAGWEPGLVVTTSGVVERDCVFTTPQGDREATWYVTRHEPGQLYVEMLKITPQVTACRIEIQLQRAAAGCTADVTYTHTSLGPQGDDFVAGFTAAYYVQFMQDWERELNQFLARNG